MWREVALALAPAWPAAGALVVGGLSLRRRAPSERTVVTIATAALLLTLLSVTVGIVTWIGSGLEPVDVRLGHWFRAGDYGFELAFLVDGTSAPAALVASILLLATSKFSANYLHREPGFTRFFTLTLAFAAGIELVSLGGTIELVFAGWELVGVASVLLVGFFHERAEPTRAAIRVLVTYRICDVGLVVAAVLLHQWQKTTVIADLVRAPAVATSAAEHVTALVVGVGILIAAMGKSAQFPVGGWLPRAMEGPTASSAVFYGGLSVHAGVFLLVRLSPLYAGDPVIHGALVVVGATTAAFAALSGQVSPDAKTSLSYATIAQVGLMFVECGLGFPRLALVHLVAHAFLRYYQFLRTPSVLQDALERRGALGATLGEGSSRRWEILGLDWRRFLYRLAIERFEVEATLERWIARPALGLARACDGIERSLFEHHEAKEPDDAPKSEDSPKSEDVLFPRGQR